MSNYVIYTDSACDIRPELLEEWGIKCLSLTFRFNGEEECSDNAYPLPDFYQKMRDGGVAKTAAVNSETFELEFEKTLKEGNDIVYLAFSSGLSTTYNSARIAVNNLSGAYPERKIFAVDSLCASAGQGLLLYLANEKKKNGASIEEVVKFIEDTRLKICHWFTVDDLVYLKRGGRISPALAFVGNVLGLKPVLHVDNDGHLVNVSKVRGRKTSIAALCDKIGELADDSKSGTVFICHGDCVSDAQLLADMVNSKYGATVDVITYTGAVIGAHSGPGTLAIFFVGKER